MMLEDACADVVLTSCYVPCVPSSEEERKHGSQEHTRITDTANIIGECDNEWDSLSEVGGRRNNNL